MFNPISLFLILFSVNHQQILLFSLMFKLFLWKLTYSSVSHKYQPTDAVDTDFYRNIKCYRNMKSAKPQRFQANFSFCNLLWRLCREPDSITFLSLPSTQPIAGKQKVFAYFPFILLFAKLRLELYIKYSCRHKTNCKKFFFSVSTSHPIPRFFIRNFIISAFNKWIRMKEKLLMYCKSIFFLCIHLYSDTCSLSARSCNNFQETFLIPRQPRNISIGTSNLFCIIYALLTQNTRLI